MSVTATEIIMAHRPDGAIRPGDLVAQERTLPAPQHGEVLVRNLWMSVDPYMRLYLSEQSGAHAPLQPGDVLEGGAVGQVVESASDSLAVGDTVVSPGLGWRSAYVAGADMLRKIDPSLAPIQHYLGVLGLTGITAYAGLMDVLKPKEGESLFVSGAAGAVGSVVVQLARLQGVRVIASAGSDEKGRWLTDELGADAFINYRTEELRPRLQAFAPGGIDMFFDNVGGSHLEAALDCMAVRGRIALCGAVEQYDHKNYRSGPGNLFSAIEKGVTLQGFNAGLYMAQAPGFIMELAKLLGEGKLVWRETVVDGLENAVSAFQDMLAGKNFGKMLVRLAA